MLSVVVTVVSDTSEQAGTAHLEGCLEALRQQVDPPPMEVLVTCDARLRGIKELERRFPEASFIAAEKLRTASAGPSLADSHDQLRWMAVKGEQGSITSEITAPLTRKLGCALVDMLRSTIGGRWCDAERDSPSFELALLFGDFGRYQNPVQRGPSAYVSDANVCYKREALQRVAGAWTDTYSESRVHAALADHGEVIALSPDVIVNQHRLNLRLRPALVERFVWGRSYAAVRVESVPGSRRILYAALSPLLPFVLLLRQWGNVVRTKRNQVAFLKALPLTFLLDVAWSWGEFVGYVTRHP